jgi:hypothetical protein
MTGRWETAISCQGAKNEKKTSLLTGYLFWCFDDNISLHKYIIYKNKHFEIGFVLCYCKAFFSDLLSNLTL